MTNASETPERAGSPELTQPPQVKEPGITIVCETSAGDGEYQYQYAVLTLELPLVMHLLKMIALCDALFAKMDETFYRVSFFDYNVTYYRYWQPVDEDGVVDAETLLDDLPDTDWREPPAGYKPGSQPTRAQLPTVEIDENSVVFSCVCGDDNTRVETQRLSVDYLRKIATRLLTMSVTPTLSPPLCLSPGSSSARIIDIPER